MTGPGRLAAAAVISLLLPSAAFAVITFEQLDEDLFIVSHRVKGPGSRGQAMSLVYEKAASLCIAAGYSYFRIFDQESAASQRYQMANASVRVQFFWDDGAERIGCEDNASLDYIAEATDKLARAGYVRPERQTVPASPAGSSENGPRFGSCTLEQVAAMARAGLSDEQIRAACP